MVKRLKIEFISDVVCPWCVIGLLGLERALESLAGGIEADVVFEPFELNPDLPSGGELVSEHIRRKYGRSEAEAAQTRAMIRERALALSFEMPLRADARIFNTRKAHELLAWAEPTGRQKEVKLALMRAYFQEGRDPSDPEVLSAAAEAAGLDGGEALRAVEGGGLAGAVAARETRWREEGVTGVPTLILQDRYMLVGGQAPEAYARALASLAAEA